jgi:putative PIN family toxin of toxin-antitoxin system
MRLAALDTNILVSSFIAPYGNEARIIDLVRAEALKPAISEPLLAEYGAVLARTKFRFNQARIDEILLVFSRFGVRVNPQRQLAVSPHEPDNRLLECAEAAQADFLITGNLRHFPASYGRTRILNAKAFLDLVDAAAAEAAQ